MEYNAKSAIIGRIKKAMDQEETEDTRPCFIALYDVDKPHVSGKAPMKVLEFIGQKVCIRGGTHVDFLLLGKDILLDNLEHLTIEEDKQKKHIVIVAKQVKSVEGKQNACV